MGSEDRVSNGEGEEEVHRRDEGWLSVGRLVILSSSGSGCVNSVM